MVAHTHLSDFTNKKELSFITLVNGCITQMDSGSITHLSYGFEIDKEDQTYLSPTWLKLGPTDKLPKFCYNIAALGDKGAK